MKKSCLCILILLWISSIYSFGQSPSAFSKDIVSVNPACGQMQYQLPLYEISTPDFHWPIAMSYTSDGFYPFEYSSPVGYGWNLIAGGSITREVIGFADDLCIEDLEKKYGGYLAYVRDTSQMPSFVYETRDIASDLYHFSFAGYSGSFIIDGQNRVKILSGDIVKVDLSGMGLQPHRAISLEASPSRYSRIIISTADGCKYYFGGEEDYLEFSNGSVESSPTSTITAWYLHKVDAPSGASITFWNRSKEQSPLWQYDKHYQWYEEVDFLNNHLMNDHVMVSSGLDMYEETACHMGYDEPATTRTKICLIDSITLSPANLSICFSYDWRDNHVYIDPRSNFRQQMPFLNRVDVRSGTQTLQRWNLSYQAKTYGNRTYQFLTSVSNHQGDSFFYGYFGLEDVNTTPSGDDLDCDVFGYSNTHPMFGALIQSTNALGATNSYVYEPASYSRARAIYGTGENLSSTAIPYNQLICHSIRIDSIRVWRGNKIFLSKKYHYQYTSGQPSGALLADYAFYGNGQYNFFPFQKTKRTGTHILYSEVQEDVRDFIDMTHHRNIYRYPDETQTYRMTGENLIGQTDIYSIVSLSPYFLLQNELQSPVLRQLYDGVGRKMREVRYSYGTLDTESQNLLLTNSAWRITTHPKQMLLSKTSVEYSRANFDSLVEMSTFSYDTLQYRIKKEQYSCGEEKRFVRYVYPDDILTAFLPIGHTMDSCYSALAFLVNEGIIRDPIERYEGYESDNIEYVTSGQLLLSKISSPSFPHSNRRNRVVTELRLLPELPITNYNPVQASRGSLLYHQDYDTVAVTRFNYWNRLAYEKTQSDSIPVEYTWTADKLYPREKKLGSMIWNYTYLPFVGLTSETDPRGKTIYYQYDAYGRLADEYYLENNIKKIINHYIYR